VRTADFDYELPTELIAQTPIEPRDASRLMVVDRKSGQITHRHFCDLPSLLRSGDRLVLNQSRVIPARIYALKPTGGKVEILLLRQRADGKWETLVRGKRINTGLRLTLLEGQQGDPTDTHAEVIEVEEQGFRVLDFDHQILPLADRIGTMPLPPYIHHPLDNGERYQTIYARAPGSAAAPTAGLHFTPETMISLRDRGIGTSYATLHVGLDTFRPVTEETLEDHKIHTEYCVLDSEEARLVNQTKLAAHRIVAVGTTSVRILETAARAAAGKTSNDASCPLQTVVAYNGPTSLFIYPGFRFSAVDVLITNFHLPRSTLLMLVSAFAGKDLIDRAYAEAIQQRYRFYSFGDAMIIL
jgi:S-adenosylmethionine:tRNA ribosyltransferase-isomerase